MSALRSENIDPLFTAGSLAPRADVRDMSSAGRSIWVQQLTILTFFWIYVASSNILYANAMRASMEGSNTEHPLFAPWDARLAQHLFLYPVLVGCVWLALRIGWQPLWRALPLQALCAVFFSALPAPVLWLCEQMFGTPMMKSHEMPASLATLASSSDMPIWLAVGTSFLLTYFFALALLTGFTLYRRLRDSQLRAAALERALSAAQLAALRLQLSPHTLFNLLHTIRGHITWDPVAAQAMIVQLGELLRRLLAAGEREFTRLPNELQFVRLYLELQQRRFADRLSVVVPDGSELPAVWVPSLILQALVENAVVHGLAAHDGAVAVSVEVRIEADQLVLRVINTIAPQRVDGAAGIGLTNVRERLAIQFGGRASFSAGPADGNVWLAEARIPLLRDGPP